MYHQPAHVLTQIAKGLALVLQLIRAIGIVAFVVPYATSVRRDAIIQRWCIKVLNILNLRVRTRGYLPIPTWAPAMFVANHISWLDILLLTAIHPMYFVAKSEVRAWPLIGWIAAQAGTIFVDRERGKSLSHVTQSLTQSLDKRKCVAMFPEATTTDGSTLKPFHTSLFQAAVDSQAPVWPVAIKYCHFDGTLDRTPAFLGNQTLVQSISSIVSQREMFVELHFCKPISSKDQSRWELARGAEHAIASRLQLTPTCIPPYKVRRRPPSRSSLNPTSVA